MLKVVSRKEALGMIDSIFTSFHFGLMSITDSGIENSWEREYFWTEANKVDQGRLKKEYEQTVNSLDSVGFNAYYKYIGEFAKKYKIGCWEEYNQYEPILIEELNEELGKHEKTNEIIDIINSFKIEELLSEKFLFSSKVQILNLILDDFSINDDKTKCINKILGSFNNDDKEAFLTKLQNEPKFLEKLFNKIDVTQKDEMIILIGDLFVRSGFIKDQKMILLNNKESDYITALYDEGVIKIAINKETNKFDLPVSPEIIKANPFDIVCINHKEKQIRIPAFVLNIKTPDNENKILKKFKYDSDDSNKTIEEFKYSNSAEQYVILQSIVTGKKGADKGKAAKVLRDNIESFKLDSLFSEHNNFMNEDLRDFLNCKEDGTENYTLEEVINGTGWYEFKSKKSACHQQKHLFTKTGKPLFNAKFGNKDGREVVFNAKYQLITDYPDKGTFNYVVPEGFFTSKSSLEHKKYDVNPYYPLMEEMGYDSGLGGDFYSWFRDSFWNETSYFGGYNTEVWDLLQDEKFYRDELMSKEKELEWIKELINYENIKKNSFKGTGKKYPQSYIDYFINES